MPPSRVMRAYSRRADFLRETGKPPRAVLIRDLPKPSNLPRARRASMRTRTRWSFANRTGWLI